MKTRVIIALAALVALSGCQSLTGYKAEEVHHTVSFPLVFSDSIHAVGIKKETAPDGTATYKAETLTHETTISGFTRTATYKGAELNVKK